MRGKECKMLRGSPIPSSRVRNAMGYSMENGLTRGGRRTDEMATSLLHERSTIRREVK